MRSTKGHELLWVYSKNTTPRPGMELDGIDILRAVGNALIVLGECNLKNQPGESIIRMINTLATVAHMLHTETNLLRKTHGLAPLSVTDIAKREKNV